MDTLAGIIIGPIIMVYGIFVYKGKMLWFLTSYKERFKDENYKKKIHRTYGKIFIIIGIIILTVGIILYTKGIETTKNNYLY